MADSGRSYEEQRERNIEQNRRYLADLGLAAVPAAPVFGDGGTRRVHRKGSGGRGGGGAIRTIRDVTPVKKSRRLLGEKAPDFHKLDVEDAVTLARTGQLQVDDPDQEAPVPQAVYKRSKREDPDSDAPLPAEAYAPLSLLSVSTTILDLGRLVTGPDKYLYWSNRGCMFKHPYPVGYKATRWYARHHFLMEILEGAPGSGPVFRVTRQTGSPLVFTGTAPSNPWAEICMLHMTPKTRVSGPLFYGFSDRLTQKLITQMPGYQPWEEIRAELKAMAPTDDGNPPDPDA